MEDKILDHFFTPEGLLKNIPAQLKKKLVVFAYIAEKLEFDRKYTEKEINEHIKQFHPDFATIRREFVDSDFMSRKDGIYELNPRQMWRKIE